MKERHCQVAKEVLLAPLYFAQAIDKRDSSHWEGRFIAGLTGAIIGMSTVYSAMMADSVTDMMAITLVLNAGDWFWGYVGIHDIRNKAARDEILKELNDLRLGNRREPVIIEGEYTVINDSVRRGVSQFPELLPPSK